ncbi:alkaline phosphatase D family protein [Sinomicrobium sp. M5D2P17]
MNRRENIKSLFLGGVSASLFSNCVFSENGKKIPENKEATDHDISNWDKLPDMDWAGPKYWANRLQDWNIKDGLLQCVVQGKNRTFHHLSMQLGNSRNSFVSRVGVRFSKELQASDHNRIGFVLGAKSWNFEYRASAVHGDGLRIGVTTSGNLFIGSEEFYQSPVKRSKLAEGVVLEAFAEPLGKAYHLTLNVFDKAGNPLGEIEKNGVAPEDLIGNIALLCHFEEFDRENADGLVCSFDKWELSGDKFMKDNGQFFGPLCFTQYTRQKDLVKLTAQLCPIPLPSKVGFEIKRGDTWKLLQETEVQYPSYTAQFRFDNWSFEESTPFRVSYSLGYTDGSKETSYWEGTIAREPLNKEFVKALVCSCNHDMGFPDQDVVEHASMHEPDLVMFLGDQFYEINGHFGFQTAPLEKAYLDYLRKWYMFGWSFRKLFQHIPTINLPDDHDVFQGNLFGANGIEFPKASIGKRYERDYGGFMMPPEWVNLAMTTQTSHMPDPYDPHPIERGIHVFYSNWDYAGISFGIVEDRKFKSGPATILPEEATVRDAFVENTDYPIKENDYPEAHLLGTRQMEFLKEWTENWSGETEMKVLVSCTPFHALQTLPDENSNGMQQRLDIPEKDEYVQGDVAVADMDSGGWPQYERDKVLRLIRKSYALHLAGDQHLPSVSQYGVDSFQDAGYSFAVPAIGNSWPRRWWPTIREPLEGQPEYTGNHEDAFGNKLHVRAVANPYRTGLEPSRLYDRSPGYGIVTFNKRNREVKLECWPRYVNPRRNPDGQFRGWPVTINQMDNYRPQSPYFLPKLKVKGLENPLFKVLNDREEPQLIMRPGGTEFQPVMDRAGIYTVRILDSEGKTLKQLDGIEAIASFNERELEISV